MLSIKSLAAILQALSIHTHTKPYVDIVATDVAADVDAALHANNANGGRSLALASAHVCVCVCVY